MATNVSQRRIRETIVDLIKSNPRKLPAFIESLNPGELSPADYRWLDAVIEAHAEIFRKHYNRKERTHRDSGS